MKYTIHINQKKLLEIWPRAKLKPSIILDYIARWHLASRRQSEKAIFDNEEYTRINYPYLMAEMPLLECKNKARIGVYIKELVKGGLLKTRQTKDNTLYARLTDKALSLYFDTLDTKPKQGGYESDTGLDTKVEQHKHSINKHSINSMSAKVDENNFSLEEKLQLMEKDPKRHIQIICLYWKFKKFNIDNKEQYQTLIQRDLKSATRLVGFSDEQILEIMEYLQDENTFKWGLETVLKYVGEDLKQLKPITR